MTRPVDIARKLCPRAKPSYVAAFEAGGAGTISTTTAGNAINFSRAGVNSILATDASGSILLGGGGVAGNIIAGGVTGLVVDTVTGAGFDHVPNPLKVALVPITNPPLIKRDKKRK